MTETATQDPPKRPYFRGDQSNGISPPDLTKTCTYADHIVHARGKRTRFTSVSLDRLKIGDFGEVVYQLLRDLAEADGHAVIEHETLIEILRGIARNGERGDRQKAIVALGHATRRREGLIEWSIDISRWDRKDVIHRVGVAIQKYFARA